MRYTLFGVAGWSGSGKTTLLEKMLPILQRHGLRINVIKRSHHNIVLEPDTKDSARMRAAGAAEVMLSSPYRYLLIHELREEKEPSLDALQARLSPADLTLVEGFKMEAFPKLEVYRPALQKPALFLEDEQVVAVASDMPAPEGLRAGLLWFDLNAPESICDWLVGH